MANVGCCGTGPGAGEEVLADDSPPPPPHVGPMITSVNTSKVPKINQLNLSLVFIQCNSYKVTLISAMHLVRTTQGWVPLSCTIWCHMSLIPGSSYSNLTVHSRSEVVFTLQLYNILQLFHNITSKSIYKIYLQYLKNITSL